MAEHIFWDQFIQKWHRYINNSLHDQFYCDLKKKCLFSECNRKWITKFQTSNIVYQSKQDIGHDLISREDEKYNFVEMILGQNSIFCFHVKKNIIDYKKNCSFIMNLYIICMGLSVL